MTPGYRARVVSVIVPTYNRANLLPDALDSVAAQSYRPIEVIVVDDGSMDDTTRIVREWVRNNTQQDLVARYFSVGHFGAPAARNYGLLESSGEFIQYLDSDDLLHPDKLCKQVGLLNQEPEIDMVYSLAGSFTVSPDWAALPYAGLPARGSDLMSQFLQGGMWNTICGVYRRDACVRVGPWSEDLLIMQDWDYSVRLILGGVRAMHLPQTLSLHRWGDDGRVTALRTSEAMLRSMLRGQLRWAESIQFAGRMTCSTRRALVELILGVVAESLRQGYSHVTREALAAAVALDVDHAEYKALRGLKALSVLPPGLVARGLQRKRQFGALLQARG